MKKLTLSLLATCIIAAPAVFAGGSYPDIGYTLTQARLAWPCTNGQLLPFYNTITANLTPGASYLIELDGSKKKEVKVPIKDHQATIESSFYDSSSGITISYSSTLYNVMLDKNTLRLGAMSTTYLGQHPPKYKDFTCNGDGPALYEAPIPFVPPK